MRQKYLLLSLIILSIIAFTGCSTEDSNDQNDLYTQQANEYILPNATNPDVKYDYYEIQGDDILHTQINMDILNVVRYFNIDLPSYANTMYYVDENYHEINTALNIDQTINAMIYDSYEPIGDITTKTIYKSGYGIYLMYKNYCIHNTEVDNCKAYMYVRYE